MSNNRLRARLGLVELEAELAYLKARPAGTVEYEYYNPVTKVTEKKTAGEYVKDVFDYIGTVYDTVDFAMNFKKTYWKRITGFLGKSTDYFELAEEAWDALDETDDVLSGITKAAQKGTDALNGIKSIGDGLKGVGNAIGGAANGIGGLGNAVGGLSNAIAAAEGAVGGLGAGLGAAIGGIGVGIGAVLGASISAVGGLFGALFGSSDTTSDTQLFAALLAQPGVFKGLQSRIGTENLEAKFLKKTDFGTEASTWVQKPENHTLLYGSIESYVTSDSKYVKFEGAIDNYVTNQSKYIKFAGAI